MTAKQGRELARLNTDKQSPASANNPDNIDVEVRKTLKSMRRQAGLTQAEVASHLSISPQQYQKYEKGPTKCSIVTLYKLSELYDRPVGEFLPGIIDDSHGFNEEAQAYDPTDKIDFTKDAAVVSELLAIFIRIPSNKTRRKLLDLLNEIF